AKLRVASLEMNGLKTEFADATKIWKIKSPSELVSITTRRGKQLTLTPATPVLVFENGEVKWKKSGELTGSEWIASSRLHPALKGKQTALLPLVSTATVHVANPITDFFINVTNKLAKTNGSLQNVAAKYNISRDLMYAYRLKDHKVPLNLLLAMCKDAGIDNQDIYNKITTIQTKDNSYISLPTFLTSEISYLAGVLAGDGDISRGNSGGIRFTSISPEHLEFVQKLLIKNFNVNPKISKQAGKTPQIRVSSIVLRDIFTKLGVPAGEKSHAIDLPALLTQSGAENVAAFIRGWMDTDGYVAMTKHGSVSIGLATASEKAARKLLLLFEWFGIKAKLRIRDNRGYTAEIRGKKIVTKLLSYQVEIRGSENFKAYAKAIGFWKKEKQVKLQQLLSKQTKTHSNVDGVPVSLWLQTLFARYQVPQKIITWAQKQKVNPTLPSRSQLAKIAEYLEKINAPEAKALKIMAQTDVQWETITKLNRVAQKNEWVYDFTIPGDHAFLANGILVHNTASAEKDELTGGWILKAGAMVLGSGGTVMIDEFDKMSDEDRGALHEALEQQKITIAKAGMLTTFQTKAAVLAAANPKHGRFDPNTPPASQFDIPPTLLSRFDLIFTIKDVLDEAHDRKLAEHIIKGHMAGAQNGPIDADILPTISADLLRKYIAYARRTCFPLLTNEANEKIKDFYLDLRRKGKKDNTFAVTARQIEGIIRLAEASAKVRLSPKVELQDAERSIALVSFVLHDVFMDKETGLIDSDIINVGQPKSKVDKLRTLLNIITSLEKQFDLVDVDDVVKEGIVVGRNACLSEIKDLLTSQKEDGK
ncbi:MAG: LAGLIDADG family homing endonuclease, partial [Candidatus Micrarchaeota archaeon]